MKAQPSRWAYVFRAAASAGFIGVVAGLPIAVELTSTPLAIFQGTVLAGAIDGVPIVTPVRLSERLPLVLESGLVSSGRKSAADDGRSADTVTVDDGVVTFDLAQKTASLAPPGDTSDVASAAPVLSGLKSGSLRVRRGTVVLVAPDGRRANLRDVTAAVSVTRKGSYKLVGTGQLNGQRFHIDAIWSDGAPREEQSAVPLRLTLKSGLLEASLDGQFRDGALPVFTGQAEFQLPSVRRFLSWAGIARGVGDEIKTVAVSGPVEFTPTHLTFTKASIALDNNHATGALALRHSGPRPAIDGTLGFEELELARHLSLRLPGVAAQPNSAPDPHLLTAVDVDLRLSANKVTAPGIDLGRGAVTLALNRGRLQADIAELEVGGGTATGQLAVDLNDSSPKAQLKIKLRGIDAGRILAAPLHRNPLLGRTNLAFEGSAEGTTWPQLATSIAGRGQFELTEQGRLGLDLATLTHAARSATSVGWSAAGKGGTALEALSGKFRVVGGAVTVETMQARSGATIMMASGQVDVPGRLVDMTISASQAGASDATVGAPDILLVRGAWDTPAISLVKPAKAPAKAEAGIQ